MPLFKRGDVVNIFQMSVNRGLLFEGKATVRRYNGSPGDPWDEHYWVSFHEDGKPTRDQYQRFIDREGQGDPQQYVEDFNKRIGYRA